MKIMKTVMIATAVIALVSSIIFYTHDHKINIPLTERDVVAVDTQMGTGAVAEKGKVISIHYDTFLAEGMKKIDSSRDRNLMLTVVLGRGQIVPGWERGMIGMKVGGRRKITVPSRFAYGEKGAGRIVPPNSDLIYDVELMALSEQLPADHLANAIPAQSKKAPETKVKVVKKAASPKKP